MNVKNTFGVGAQAIAISQYGSRVGFYACGFYGHQDTVYTNRGTQVYLKGYIEVCPGLPPYIYIFKTRIWIQGATDFIFGQMGHAYFGGNTIAVNGPGWVTASGRQSDDSGSCAYPSHVCLRFPMFYPLCLLDVFNQNTIILASGALNGTSGNVYFGRPWRSKSQSEIKSIKHHS